jgi:hypothetical protein
MLKAILLVALPLFSFSSISNEHTPSDRDVPLSKISRLAKDLAKYHFEDAAEIVITKYEELGATEQLVLGVRKAVAKSLEKELKKPPTAKQIQTLAKASRAVAAALVKEAANTEDGGFLPEELLTAALAFDSQDEGANEALGNQRCDDGVWRSAEGTKVFTRRTEMATNAERLRRKDYTLNPIPKEQLDPILLSATIGPASGLRGTGELKDFTLCSSTPYSTLRQEALKLLRTMHFSSWLVIEDRMATSPSPSKGVDYTLLLHHKEYEKAIDIAAGAGRYDQEASGNYTPQEAKQALGGFWSNQPKKSFIDERLWLSALNSFQNLNGSGVLQEGALLSGPEWLRLANNEYCVRYMYGESVARLLGKTVDEELSTQAQKIVRTSRLLPTAGIIGCREYVRQLVIAGKDPHISRILHIKQDADLSGDLRMKAISIVEFLHETELFAPFIKGTAGGPEDLDYSGVLEQTEKAFGLKLDEFEEKWESWILGNKQRSVIDLLGAAHDQKESGQLAVVLTKLNAHRKAANVFNWAMTDLRLGEVALSADLSRGCQLHADYLDNHPERHGRWPDAHLQDARDDDFSPEGAWAGRKSVIAFKGAEACIDEWLGTFYHRLPLTTANLIKIGFGVSSKGVAVLDAGSLSSPSGNHAIVWPYKGQESVGLRFIPEVPNPLDPQGANSQMLEERGYPITLQCGQGTLVRNVRLWVTKSGSEDSLAGDLIGPDNAIFPEDVPKFAWCFIPSKPLKPKTTYTVYFQLEDGGFIWESTFKTGMK